MIFRLPIKKSSVAALLFTEKSHLFIDRLATSRESFSLHDLALTDRVLMVHVFVFKMSCSCLRVCMVVCFSKCVCGCVWVYLFMCVCVFYVLLCACVCVFVGGCIYSCVYVFYVLFVRACEIGRASCRERV